MFSCFDRLFLYTVTISKFSKHLPDWQAGWMRLRQCADVWYFLLALPFSMWPHALFTMVSMMLLRQNLPFPYGLLHDALAVQTSFQTIRSSQFSGEVLSFCIHNVSWMSLIFLMRCFEIALLYGVTWLEPFWQSHGHPTACSQSYTSWQSVRSNCPVKLW